MTIVKGRLGPIISGASGEVWYTESQELFRAFHRLIMPVVVDKDLATPPGSPTAAQLWIVAASPTGAWVGKTANLAGSPDGGTTWEFYAPLEGMGVWVADEDLRYDYNGAAWAVAAGGGGGGDANVEERFRFTHGI